MPELRAGGSPGYHRHSTARATRSTKRLAINAATTPNKAMASSAVPIPTARCANQLSQPVVNSVNRVTNTSTPATTAASRPAAPRTLTIRTPKVAGSNSCETARLSAFSIGEALIQTPGRGVGLCDAKILELPRIVGVDVLDEEVSAVGERGPAAIDTDDQPQIGHLDLQH